MSTTNDLADDHIHIMQGILALQSELQTLQASQLGGDQNTQQILGVINTDLTTFVTEYKDAIEKDKEQTLAGGVKAVAAGLPGTTRAVLAAVTVYSRRPVDPIAGSAAAMDMVTGLASIVGGLAGMAGPIGAAVAGLTSMLSMILGFFAPKPDDLVTQIEKLLRTINAEDKDISIRAAADGVRVYANACNVFMKLDAARKIIIDPDPATLALQLAKVNLIEGNIIMSIRNVEHWLEKGSNQNLDEWPEIFKLLCDTYFQLDRTVTEQYAYAHNLNYMNQYLGNNDSKYAQRAANWDSLKTQTKAKKANLDQNNQQVVTFLNKVLPVARKQAMYIMTFHRSGASTGTFDIVATTGPGTFRDRTASGTAHNGVWDNMRRMSITPPRGA